MVYLSQKLDIALLLGYYDHVLKLPMNFFGTRKVGEIISLFQDASSIRDAISNATLIVMIDTLMAVVGGLILFFKNKTLFAIAFVMVILYALLVLAFNKPYKKANEKIKISSDNKIITGCECPNFTSIHTEFISGFDIVDSAKKPNDISYYEFYCRLCEEHGINVRYFLEYQIMTDLRVGKTKEVEITDNAV